MLRVKLVKSPIGNTARNRATVQALGLRKVHHVVEHDDSPAIRGMIHRVKHLLEVEVAEGSPARLQGKGARVKGKAKTGTRSPSAGKEERTKGAKEEKRIAAELPVVAEDDLPVPSEEGVAANPAPKKAAAPKAAATKASPKPAAKKAAPKEKA